MRILLLALCLAVPQWALAQIGLPVRVPELPGLATPNLPPAVLPQDADRLAAAGQLDPKRLRDLRRQRIRELLRVHRDVLEADPHGEPLIRGEVLALAPGAQTLPAAAAAGLSVVRELPLGELGTRILVLHAAGNTARALAQLRALDPGGAYDFNHVYSVSGVPARSPAALSGAPPEVAVGRPAAPDGAGSLGLIDSGVDAGHEAFAGVPLHQHGCSAQAVPAEHGTAVASLMVGSAATFHGAAPGHALYAADVFCGQPTGGAVDAVADAFMWLLRERVAVINVSLVGPPNRLLESIVEQAIARGHIVVAAVGNDGPAAPPLYPAAWPGVVAVTAVDARQRVLVEAGRSAQVKFAAPGADMVAARPVRGYTLVRGTSFAAPLVAGLLARGLAGPDKDAAEAAIMALARSARRPDAAEPDPVYGFGVVGAELRAQPALAALGRH